MVTVPRIWNGRGGILREMRNINRKDRVLVAQGGKYIIKREMKWIVGKDCKRPGSRVTSRAAVAVGASGEMDSISGFFMRERIYGVVGMYDCCFKIISLCFYLAFHTSSGPLRVEQSFGCRHLAKMIKLRALSTSLQLATLVTRLS